MRGPPITVRCDCGQLQYVPYGKIWECPSCGRRWNTNQIPPDEYWGILREMRRYRLQVIGMALAIGGVFAALALIMGTRALVLVPLFMGGWFYFYMPQWRRKVRARARGLPTWQLHPE